ncbi:uncharacterized protein L3040_009020 [Drepanopeziza brunnea f. sp. 'multigermtubi']|uniref:uncharacterized protein n=1 Tax=Drepanopeziza brunnea f. sp. 'multigermtubi' TaxID=698441 RepID=UPI0023A25812|nr:hypothetical protein L3040_009020 [Drepanopeziza brunnea f. sp. 'multigermtubi']
MLMPSALGCESSLHAPKTRFQSALFASPPLSPSPPSTRPAINNLYSTCRALQSMLSPPNQLPSPPTRHAEPPSSPVKLRLRARKGTEEPTTAPTPRRKIAKRSAAVPPRGLHKRRRATSDEMTRDDSTEEEEEEEEGEGEASGEEEAVPCDGRPSTPKRMRLAPEIIPLGLERSDFHDLRLQEMASQAQGDPGPVMQSIERSGFGPARGLNPEEWSMEEDRLLVELVLEKLKLTKSDWQECARSLGKDRGSVGRRWKSLMGGGEVGLKRNLPRRAKLHGTWR